MHENHRRRYDPINDPQRVHTTQPRPRRHHCDQGLCMHAPTHPYTYVHTPQLSCKHTHNTYAVNHSTNCLHFVTQYNLTGGAYINLDHKTLHLAPTLKMNCFCHVNDVCMQHKT